MKTIFYGKRISGILSLLPETEYNFEDDMKYNNLSEKQNRKLQKTMGYDRHRFFKSDTYVSKVAIFGLKYMFEKNILKKDDISALIVTTTTPDFLMPATSNLIMSELDLDNSVFCMDTNQQCAGFTNGLLQAFMLLNNNNMKKVVLITGDVLAKNPDRSNTSSYPLSGDAICITIIENCDKNLPIYFHSIIDAKKYDALVFPSMGFRVVTEEERKKFASEKYGGYDYLPCVHMDGQAVFQYVMQDVPKYVYETLEFAKTDKGSLNYYFFHQPNKFMVDKLAQKIDVSAEKVPSNVVTFYGNSNSSTIPVAICHNAKDEMLSTDNYKCMLAGFGAGLSYSGIVMNLGEFDFCEMLITTF
ncbi:3-oxoacyl-[acyl-carrier-protein] synthase III C-terminal domain-containing protein [Aliarcobacter butzleri]|uniref:3-oxoacyl-[acyl-carrier-protein] synthase III C-terminal domain-containing protein n=1 Tax=Aliarcobacter butzleri TaxID=28197 RepID=UPI000F46C203|nr:3-oxoacyl-[acyl-carrier-protein] synthase III C-terminal domain-containing protein [Aliarcobacter butzleri]